MSSTLAYVAAITDDIAVRTNTCLPPLRHPVLLTKTALTLEAPSGGWGDAEVAPGWMENEFEVLDVPFEERSARTDKFLRLFDRARTKGVLAFEGEYYSFQETGIFPQSERGRLKIWVGSGSTNAFRRLAEFGDGWTTLWARPESVASQHVRLLRAGKRSSARANPTSP